MADKLEPQKVLDAIENCSVEDQQIVLQYAYETIKQLMTDTVPVVRGHWVVKEKMGKLICSNCGKGINAMGEMQIILAKEHERYCYHCGAKMDGKDGDSDASD